jgi:hypothetical protein
MPSHPVGTTVQPRSRTALYAAIAATLEDVPKRRFDEYFASLGLAIGRDGAEKAASPHRAVSQWKLRRGRPGAVKPKKTSALRPWLLVDERALLFERALILFDGKGRARSELVRALSSTPGIRQIIETGRRRDVVAVALFQGLVEREQLRARLEELDEPFFWEDIVFETHEPAIQTWKTIAQSAAAEEQFEAK